MAVNRKRRLITSSSAGLKLDYSGASGPDLLKVGASGGLQRPVTPSKELAAITGTDPLSRSQMVKRVWDHIKANNLQNPANKREIVADDKLRKVFGKDKVSMFEMNKHLSRHVG
jgi:chromatin remodeling complex protein RSC6